MKCPFLKRTEVTKGTKETSYSYPKDKIMVAFGECYKENCMAYDIETRGCLKIQKEKI